MTNLPTLTAVAGRRALRGCAPAGVAPVAGAAAARLARIAAIAVLCLAGVAAAAPPVRVVCATTDLAALAAAAGGEAVEVEALARGAQDPHYLQARPSYMRTLNKAHLLVYNGLQLESGWLPLLIEGSRNPRVAAGKPGHLDASQAISPLEIPTGEVDRSMGDIHPEGNPHYALDPRNGRRLADLIAARLGQLAPDGRTTIDGARQAFVGALTDSIAVWQERAAGLRGLRVVSYHKQFEYLADWLGLEIVAYVEDRPGIPPSPRHIEALEAQMRREGIRIILESTYVDPTPAQRLAERTGATVVVLPAAVGAVVDAVDYPRLFTTILDRLLAAAPTER